MWPLSLPDMTSVTLLFRLDATHLALQNAWGTFKPFWIDLVLICKGLRLDADIRVYSLVGIAKSRAGWLAPFWPNGIKFFNRWQPRCNLRTPCCQAGVFLANMRRNWLTRIRCIFKTVLRSKSIRFAPMKSPINWGRNQKITRYISSVWLTYIYI